MKVIFLDIDGVLNSREYDAKCSITGGDLTAPSPKLVVRLLGVVQETGAQLVVTSTWRFFPDYVEALMAAGLPIVGATPRGDAFGTRAAEIAGWIVEHQLEYGNGDGLTFAIVDDEADAGIGFESRFVQTDPRVGLTAADAAKIVGLFT